MSDCKYLSCAETAKLIRAALKKAFPGIKFSVRSSVYSGGSSIRIGWTDGPTTKAVEGVAKPFEGGGFDGMIDLAYYVESWLLPDGTAAFGSSRGTTGSMGVDEPYDYPPPVPGAIKVHFGGKYIFCEKSWSLPTFTAAVEKVVSDWGFPMPEIAQSSGDRTPYIVNGWSIKVANASQDLATLVHRELASENYA